jgi:hypothetical protein
MNNNNDDDSPNFETLKQKLISLLNPISSVNKSIINKTDFQFSFQRSNAGRKLSEYYLVYFMFIDLLEYNYIGHSEKVAWSIPIEYKGKYYVLEHRKLGFGLFIKNENTDEVFALEIVELITKAINKAKPYFEWRAKTALNSPQINLLNRCDDLLQRYLYFRSMYDIKYKEYITRKDEVIRKTHKTKNGEYTSVSYPSIDILKQAEWLGISVVDSFFSWTEHIFIHLAVITNGISKGTDVADLSISDWQDKFKKAIPLEDPDVIKMYNELIIIRKQISNYIAHGSFGKNGEAFTFHSGAGAAPVVLSYSKGKYNTSLTKIDPESDESVFKTIDKFITFLHEGPTGPAMLYLQESGLPTILTLSKKGTYKSALKSFAEMNELIEHLNYQFDQAANMDW